MATLRCDYQHLLHIPQTRGGNESWQSIFLIPFPWTILFAIVISFQDKIYLKSIRSLGTDYILLFYLSLSRDNTDNRRIMKNMIISWENVHHFRIKENVVVLSLLLISLWRPISPTAMNINWSEVETLMIKL